MAKPDYEKDKEKYGESDLRIRSAGRDPKKLSEAAKQHPDYKGKLEWQGVSYDNVEDYQKAIDASGASGRAGHTVGPVEVVAGAVLAPIVGGKAVATYGLDKTLEVGLGALFPDVQDTVLEQGMRAAKLGTAAKVSKLSRIAYDKILKDTFDFRIPNPFKVGEFAGGTGTGFETAAPRPAWKKTIGPAERNLFLDAFAQEVQFSPKGVNIAKRKEAGYKFLGDFASEWNSWSKSSQFIDELADRPATAYVEHLVGKGNRLDFFWRIPDNIRFRKGSRHSPNNVRILYSDRFKKLKDATENILYKQQANTPDMNRLVVDLDIPRMKGKSITVKQAPKDLVLKRVDGTIVGRLGDYHDVLYARTPILQEALTTNINHRTGRFYIDPNTRDIKKAIRAWRENILREKINFIINEAPTLEGYKTKRAKFNYQESAIREDLVNFLEEYKFIPQPKGSSLKRQLLSEPAFGLRGGKPIETQPPPWKKPRFPSKTAERKIREGKLKGSLNIDDIFDR